MADISKFLNFQWLGRGVRTALRRYLFIFVPYVLWMLLGFFDLVNINIWSAGLPVIGLGSFLAGMPLSLALRGDIFRLEYNIVDNETLLLLSMVVALVNFVLIGLLADGIRLLKTKLGAKD